MDVKYCNPHRLSFVDIASCPMVSAVVGRMPELLLQKVSERPSLLDTISNTIDLDEAPQPSVVKSTLKRFREHLCAYSALHLKLTVFLDIRNKLFTS